MLDKEDIQAIQRIMQESLSPVNDRLHTIDRRFDGIDKRLDSMDTRMEKLGAMKEVITDEVTSRMKVLLDAEGMLTFSMGCCRKIFLRSPARRWL